MAEADLDRSLARAKARLDTLDYYPEPVRIDRVRIRVAPWFFRIPGFRRYHGYAFWRTILLRSAGASDDLVTHELCHIWQGQHRSLDSMSEAPDHAVQVEPVRDRGTPSRGRNRHAGVGHRV